MLARVADAHLDIRPAKHTGTTSPTSHAPPNVKRGASIGSPTFYDRVCCCEHALIQHKHDNDDGSPASSAGRYGETRVCASSKRDRWCQSLREQHARNPPLLLCIRCARSLTCHKVSKKCACDLASAKRERRLSATNADRSPACRERPQRLTELVCPVEVHTNRSNADLGIDAVQRSKRRHLLWCDSHLFRTNPAPPVGKHLLDRGHAADEQQKLRGASQCMFLEQTRARSQPDNGPKIETLAAGRNTRPEPVAWKTLPPARNSLTRESLFSITACTPPSSKVRGVSAYTIIISTGLA